MASTKIVETSVVCHVSKRYPMGPIHPTSKRFEFYEPIHVSVEEVANTTLKTCKKRRVANIEEP